MLRVINSYVAFFAFFGRKWPLILVGTRASVGSPSASASSLNGYPGIVITHKLVHITQVFMKLSVGLKKTRGILFKECQGIAVIPRSTSENR